MWYNKLMVKKGDTLIEVVLAVGIFSMIAIAVVAVMSGGTSSAQTALETTLAREEIDSQAEALRFIHTSYIAEKDSASRKYQDVWEDIIARAIETTDDGTTSEGLSDFLQFTPERCDDLYESNDITKNHAFVINYRSLGDYVSGLSSNSPLIKYSSTTFSQAMTYPRLVYSSEDSNALSNSSATYKSLYKAEGIYIIGVRDAPKGTRIVEKNDKVAAFYDFYIRTCWYGTNAKEPSTISTVIRLYDPAAVE